MTIQKITRSGINALTLTTELLQRCRRADPVAGVFEAADMQWTWRAQRESDDIEKVFWMDEEGPVAGIWLTSSTNNGWEINPFLIPNSTALEPETVWDQAMAIIAEYPGQTFDVPIADNDSAFQALAKESGLIASDTDFTGWMDAAGKPERTPAAEGFRIVDRTMSSHTTHPMIDRAGTHVAERLLQCSLYDPTLDLAVESPNGDIAGYSLYWIDPVTKVGLVEPVRIHEDFQRKGFARAMVTEGIHRLVSKGAERIKVSWETEAAGALYLGVGFQQQSTTTWYSAPSPEKGNSL